MTSTRGVTPGAVTFDLARGVVRLGANAPGLLVPADALGALLAAAGPEARRAFGHALGEDLGRAAADRLAFDALDRMSAVLAASPEEVLTELAAAWALAGLGALGMERWGRALVMVVEGAPLGGEGDALLEAALESAISSASGREARVTAIAREPMRARFLVGGVGAAAKARALVARGLSWTEALGALHAPASKGEA
jgi:hypothetical protein